MRGGPLDRRPAPRGVLLGRGLQPSTGTMFTVLRPRFSPNWTAPAARANSVSSLPRPTLTPGWNLVPRWRIRISPAFTSWPPYRFTPRRWAFESRPLRELDAPFLCAIAVQLLLGLDVGYLDAGQLLPVTLPLVVAGLVLELVNADLRALGLPDDLADDRHLGQLGRVGRDVVAVDDEQRGERELGSRLTVELLDLDDVADGDLVLLPAGLDDRVHRDGTLLLLGSRKHEGCARAKRCARVGPPYGGPTYRLRGRRIEGQTGVGHPLSHPLGHPVRHRARPPPAARPGGPPPAAPAAVAASSRRRRPARRPPERPSRRRVRPVQRAR